MNQAVELPTSQESQSEDIIFPGHIMAMLLKISTEMSQGKAISLIPVNTELTTQEAANMMNVSRPHVVKLLEQGSISYHKAGSHRRIYLKDLLAYIEQNDNARDEALDELAALGQELGLD